MMERDTELGLSTWSQGLGLLPVPLFSRASGAHYPYVLLNGARGNFCFETRVDVPGQDERSHAWSANVGHYVSLVGDNIEVQRWDAASSSIERYTRQSVEQNLEKFHTYLLATSPNRGQSIVAHAIRTFRQLRALLGAQQTGLDALRGFLALLATAASRTEYTHHDVIRPAISDQSLEVVESITHSDWEALESNLLAGRPVDGLATHMELVLRHAVGQLFQEAHHQAVFFEQERLQFEGFLPGPVPISSQASGVGVHFTPPALARTIVERALDGLGDLSNKSVLTVFDPACGSGEFLREALRQLELRGYRGALNLVGWDVSEIACEMARFILDWEHRGSDIGFSSEIRSVDSLEYRSEWPHDVDVVVMNPPFLAWPKASVAVRASLRDVLGESGRGRSDLAFAFLRLGVDAVAQGGVLGAVVPGSFFDSDSASGLRTYVGSEIGTTLVARLGSHHLFSAATVDAGFLVGIKGADPGEVLSLWADHNPESSSAGLRTLRRLKAFEHGMNLPVVRTGFSLYTDPGAGRGARSWSPRPYRTWKMVRSLQRFPKVGDLFEVKQGARTGNNSAFVLAEGEYKALPKKERRYFRPAILNRSIIFGYLSETDYVFFPFGRLRIRDEEELQGVVPTYLSTHLNPRKQKLQDRWRNRPTKWWELTHHRGWQTEPQPKLVSTYFGGAGSFAWDDSGEFVLVQGLAWFPRHVRPRVLWDRMLALAYLAVLNSNVFSEVLSAVSNHVGGGQWNLSSKYVSAAAIPDMFSEHSDPSIIRRLADHGETIWSGQGIPEDDLEDIVQELYSIRSE